ncbi:MAG TPA: energy transducer TonB [Longimicrobiales bacterium]|nr:energy transducer TonB [Longimicrobiales bacterium]
MAVAHGVAAGGAVRPLFEQLLASRPVWDRRGSASATVAAVALHGAVAGAVLLATVVAHGAVRVPAPMQAEVVTYLRLVPPAPVPRAGELRTGAADAVRVAARTAEAELRRIVEMLPPAVVPAEVPPPAPAQLSPFAEADFGDAGYPDGAVSAAEILRERIGPTAERLADGEPIFTPYTLPPELMNRDEIRRALLREYPLGLQNMGIGGQVLMWFLIDEAGHALKWELKKSSGFRSLDRAALKVAKRMRFRPAQNYDHTVPVWVVMPIMFRVEEAG